MKPPRDLVEKLRACIPEESPIKPEEQAVLVAAVVVKVRADAKARQEEHVQRWLGDLSPRRG
jgi:hypothetical protein